MESFVAALKPPPICLPITAEPKHLSNQLIQIKYIDLIFDHHHFNYFQKLRALVRNVVENWRDPVRLWAMLALDTYELQLQS